MSTQSLAAVNPFALHGITWSYDGTVARTDDLEVARQATRRLMTASYLPAVEQNQHRGQGVYVFVFELWPGDSAWSPAVTDPQPERVVTLYYFAPSADSQCQPHWAVRDTRRLPDKSITHVFDTEAEATTQADSLDSGSEFESWETAWTITPVLHL